MPLASHFQKRKANLSLTRLRFVVLTMLMALCLPAFSADRLALVIGNAQYAQRPLLNPTNDAKAISKKLSGLGFKVTTLLELKRDDIGVKLQKFLQSVSPGDDVVFYYAGHGVQQNGQNYLIATDAKIRTRFDIARNSINVGDLLNRLDETRAAVKIVFLDACRNNPFARAVRGDDVKGLARIGGAPSGTLISFATQPGGVAVDGIGDNGLYTAQLLKHLDTPGLPVEQMLKRVAASTSQASSGTQRPWIEGSILGEFVFSQQPVSAALAMAGTSTPDETASGQNDLARFAWEIATRSDNAAAYDVFLEEFGTSKYARLARIKLAGLSGKKTRKKPAAEKIATAPGQAVITPSQNAKMLSSDKTLQGKTPQDKTLSVISEKFVMLDKQDSLSEPLPKIEPMAAIKRKPVMSFDPKASQESVSNIERKAWILAMDQAYQDASSLNDPDDRLDALERFVKDYTADNAFKQDSLPIRAKAEKEIKALWAMRKGQRVDIAAIDPYQMSRAKTAFKQGKFETALNLYLPLAKSGNAIAQTHAGHLYANGQGVEQSHESAVQWFKKAAANSYPPAMAALGWHYLEGLGVPKDPALALNWNRKAADKNNAEGMNNLGMQYAAGIGVAKDEKTAVQWFKKSAQLGYRVGQFNLAQRFARGTGGLEKSFANAAKWWRKAAEQGFPTAMTNLGFLYSKGQGVPQSDGLALSWYQKAAEQNDPWALNNMGIMYRDGRGVKSSKRKALQWFGRAASQKKNPRAARSANNSIRKLRGG